MKCSLDWADNDEVPHLGQINRAVWAAQEVRERSRPGITRGDHLDDPENAADFPDSALRLYLRPMLQMREHDAVC